MMVCVRSIIFKVLVDNELLGPITPKRGLCQGDPLAPYLFIICAEGLSKLLWWSEEIGRLHGCNVARAAPILTHLFFADNFILFCRATIEDCHHIKLLLSQ